jgi:DNA (cytosine-5)-methyltransferase 1
MKELHFVDLFCGIGGFHLAIAQSHGNAKCVLASDIDQYACRTYEANYGVQPKGDITKIDADDIPPHDLLCGGFPCQSFSSIGKREGFEHATKGPLFFEVCRILKKHKPRACFLENVTGLITHDSGNTFTVVKETLKTIGYYVTTKVFDAADFGLPAHRKRIYIVALKNKADADAFTWPTPTHVGRHVGIGTLIENHKDGYCITKHLQQSYLFKHKDGKPRTDGRPRVVDKQTTRPANTLVSTYHKIQRLTGTFVKDGKTGLRLFSENECKQMMGFPKEFKIPVSRTQMYRQTGNSVAVPVIKAIMHSILAATDTAESVVNGIITGIVTQAMTSTKSIGVKRKIY